MSDKMSELEKVKSKEIMNNFRLEGTNYSFLIQDFIDKFNDNKISVGGEIVTLDKVEEWCNDNIWKKSIITDNIFRKIMLYCLQSKLAVSQVVLGSWFGESKDLGNNIKYKMLKYYNENYKR